MSTEKDHQTWTVYVDFVGGGPMCTITGAHRIRQEDDWIIVERYDGAPGDDHAMRVWRFHGSQVLVFRQM